MASQLPPMAKDVIDLAIADLTISAVLLPVSIWITWKHGRLGTVCWPIMISYFLSRFVDDIYRLVEQKGPLMPGAVTVTMQAAGIACLLLGIIGVFYEANIILPTRHRKLPLIGQHWATKFTMAAINLINTAGIAMATYGTAPSATGADGVIDKVLGEVGNILLLLAIVGLVAWIWPTYQRIRTHSSHPNAPYARWLLWAGVAALPTQLIRTLYNTTYAFTLDTTLDPFFGAFSVKVVLLFLMQLLTALALLAGGWKSMGVSNKSQVQLVEGVSNGDSTLEDLDGRKR